jgi:hypothetical protein
MAAAFEQVDAAEERFQPSLLVGFRLPFNSLSGGCSLDEGMENE